METFGIGPLVFLPTLKHATSTTIAASLWNHDQIRTRLLLFRSNSLGLLILDDNVKEWQKVENQLFENISTLPIPKKLKKAISKFIRPLGIQILAWMNFQYIYLRLPPILPRSFIWKTHGVLDTEKIARLLLTDGQLNIYDRYKLSCAYCFEDYINPLWEMLQKTVNKKILKDKKDPLLEDMMNYWSNHRKKDNFLRKIIKSDRKIPKSEINSSTVWNNELAIKYFLTKLPHDKKEKLLEDLTWNVLKNRMFSISLCGLDPKEDQFVNILIILLTEMNVRKRTLIFSVQGYAILQCLLDWPYQILLLENAETFWALNPTATKDYDSLLLRCIDKILKGYNDCDYFELFKNIWRESPYVCKKEIVNAYVSDRGKFLLEDFFAFVTEKDIEVVLEYESLMDRKAQFKTGKSRDDFHWHTNETGIFQFFILGCLFREEVMVKYVEDYKERIGRNYKLNFLEREGGEKEVWYEFFEVLEEFFGIGEENLKNFTTMRYKIKGFGKYRNEHYLRMYFSKLSGLQRNI